jgi:hypothetical protein
MRACCMALAVLLLAGCSVLPPLTLLCISGEVERDGKRLPAFFCREVNAADYPGAP